MSVSEEDYSSSMNSSYVWDGYSLPRQIGVGTTISIMILVTTVGNLMVMIAFYHDRRINSKIANWYIVNMSVADFIVGSFTLVLSVIWTLKGWWLFGETLCKIYLLVDYITVTVPVCTIFCISLDRYWLLSKGLSYPKYATKTKAVVFIASMWLFCATYYGIATYAWIPITGFKEVIDYSWNCELESTYNFPFQIFMVAAFFILPLVVIAGLNLTVFWNIYQRSRGFVQSKPVASKNKKEDTTISTSSLGKKKPGSERSESCSLATISVSVQIKGKEEKNHVKPDTLHPDKKRAEFGRHRKAAITLAVLVVVFIVCWLPFYIAVLMGTICEGCIPHQVWSAFSYLLWGNSMINPLLYAAMNVHFRENFIRFLGLQKLINDSLEHSKTLSTSGN